LTEYQYQPPNYKNRKFGSCLLAPCMDYIVATNYCWFTISSFSKLHEVHYCQVPKACTEMATRDRNPGNLYHKKQM